MSDPLKNVLMKNRNYLLLEKIGEGAFGKIYKAKELKRNKNVAIKIEPQKEASGLGSIYGSFNLEEVNKDSFLLNEICIMLQLQQLESFPKLYAYGYERGCIYMVMSLFGENLQSYLEKSPNQFSLPTICKIALQAIDLLCDLHNKGYIHRDIKPENFVCGRKKANESIHLIDFGLSSKYLDPNNEHNSFMLRSGFVGTTRYASIYAQKGYGQSRRDDLISLGYCLIYFKKGCLPWQNLKIKGKRERNNSILEMKERYGYDVLTNNMHPMFKSYMQKVFELGYFDPPDYAGLKEIFMKALSGRDPKLIKFDWNIVEKKPKKDLRPSGLVTFSQLKVRTLEKVRNMKNQMIDIKDSIIENLIDKSFDSKLEQNEDKVHRKTQADSSSDFDISEKLLDDIINKETEANVQKILINEAPKFISSVNSNKKIESCDLSKFSIEKNKKTSSTIRDELCKIICFSSNQNL